MHGRVLRSLPDLRLFRLDDDQAGVLPGVRPGCDRLHGWDAAVKEAPGHHDQGAARLADCRAASRPEHLALNANFAQLLGRNHYPMAFSLARPMRK